MFTPPPFTLAPPPCAVDAVPPRQRHVTSAGASRPAPKVPPADDRTATLALNSAEARAVRDSPKSNAWGGSYFGGVYNALYGCAKRGGLGALSWVQSHPAKSFCLTATGTNQPTLDNPPSATLCDLECMCGWDLLKKREIHILGAQGGGATPLSTTRPSRPALAAAIMVSCRDRHTQLWESIDVRVRCSVRYYLPGLPPPFHRPSKPVVGKIFPFPEGSHKKTRTQGHT